MAGQEHQCHLPLAAHRQYHGKPPWKKTQWEGFLGSRRGASSAGITSTSGSSTQQHMSSKITRTQKEHTRSPCWPTHHKCRLACAQRRVEGQGARSESKLREQSGGRQDQPSELWGAARQMGGPAAAPHSQSVWLTCTAAAHEGDELRRLCVEVDALEEAQLPLDHLVRGVLDHARRGAPCMHAARRQQQALWLRLLRLLLLPPPGWPQHTGPGTAPSRHSRTGSAVQLTRGVGHIIAQVSANQRDGREGQGHCPGVLTIAGGCGGGGLRRSCRRPGRGGVRVGGHRRRC